MKSLFKKSFVFVLTALVLIISLTGVAPAYASHENSAGYHSSKPPAAPIVNAPSGVTNDTTPTISGTAEEDTHVNVWYIDDLGNQILICRNVRVDDQGNKSTQGEKEFEPWSCTSSKVLPERKIELVVKATDRSGRTSPATSHFFTIDLTAVDNTPPTIVSITRASPNPTSASSVDYTVTFSESVTGVDANDFGLDAGTISGATISNVTGSGSTWTVTVNTGTGNGTLHLNVPVTATITDLAGNPLGNLPFTTGETYTVEKTPTACTVQIYDDTDSNWVYTGTWATATWSEAYNSTIHYTSTVGDYAELTFTGTKFILSFTKDLNRGLIDVLVDGNKIATVDAYAVPFAFQQTYTSPTLTNGNHTVRLVHAGGRDYIDIDALQIYSATVVVPAGTYDDTDCNWVYTGTWATATWSQAYNSTLHYAGTVGDYAELTFTGQKFILSFTKDLNRGLIDVLVDGNKIATVDAYAVPFAFQQTYTSPNFPAGNHTVRLVHAGGNQYIDIDAITIQ